MKLRALVTGANKGIGKEVVRNLASTGNFFTYLAARNDEQGRQAEQEINAQYPNSVKFVHLDVAQEKQQDLVDFFTYQEGIDTLDVLVNNAAHMTQGTTYDLESAKKTLQTNFYGIVNVTETLLPMLYKSSDKGKIIHVGTKAAQVSTLRSHPYKEKDFVDVSTLSKEDLYKYAEQFLHDLPAIKSFPVYDLKFSKMLVGAYTRILAKQLESANIDVNVACPGCMGGSKAPRSAADGAKIITYLCTHHVGTGKFFEDPQREIKF